MSSLNLLESPATSPSRPGGGRHQIRRSLTEFTSPARLHRPRYLQHDDKAPQSNRLSLQMRHSIDMPVSEGVTPIMTPIQSRRASVLVQRDADDKADPRGGKEEKLSGEQDKGPSSTDGLRQSIMELNTFSTDTTQHLDETYYAVLEKMSALQNTVMALKDLAETSRDIQVGFERVAQELEGDITKQLHAIGRFDTQQSTIESLQNRIHNGREKMQALAARVDVVRERVEGWEQADKVWQERSRKRLMITWAALSVLALLVVILLMTVGCSSEGVAGSDSETQGVWRNTTSELEAHSTDKPSNQLTRDDGGTDTEVMLNSPLDDGERLRVIDEL